MNRDKYEDAWTTLLAARRGGTLKEISQAANKLAQAARALYGGVETLACSHFMVVNGHCINCHDPVQPTHKQRADSMESGQQ